MGACWSSPCARSVRSSFPLLDRSRARSSRVWRPKFKFPAAHSALLLPRDLPRPSLVPRLVGARCPFSAWSPSESGVPRHAPTVSGCSVQGRSDPPSHWLRSPTCSPARCVQPRHCSSRSFLGTLARYYSAPDASIDGGAPMYALGASRTAAAAPLRQSASSSTQFPADGPDRWPTSDDAAHGHSWSGSSASAHQLPPVTWQESRIRPAESPQPNSWLNSPAAKADADNVHAACACRSSD